MESKGVRVRLTGTWLGVALLGLVAVAGCGGGVNEGLTGSSQNTPVSGGATPTVPVQGALSISPAAATLFAGLGAPPDGCTGGVQTFVVTGEVPPFTLAANGGCLSTTTLASSGDSFTFTAGDGIGTNVGDVRAGKVIELELQETDPERARAAAEEMARKLLANTVIESYRVSVDG